MRTIMEPGDLFEDAHGVYWVVRHPGDSQEATTAQLVWFGPSSRGTLSELTNRYLAAGELPHPEGDANVSIPFTAIPEPYLLIRELGKVRDEQVR